MADDVDKCWIEQAAPGWLPMSLPSTIGHETFVSGDSSGQRLTVRYFLDRSDASLIAKAVFGPGTQGPPGHAHGGSMAALLDEAMGVAAWEQGHLAVAADLRIRFRNMLPLGSRCLVRARVASVEGRKITIEGVLNDVSGITYAEGTSIFVTMNASKFGKLAQEASRLFRGFERPGASHQ